MGRRQGWMVMAAALALACGSDGPSLAVDLRTDLVPLVEFDAIQVFVDDTRRAEPAPRSRADYVAGERVANLSGLSAGLHRVRVELRLAGGLVARRTNAVMVQGASATTIVITRDCRDVDCEEGCRNGRCVDAECSPETPDACPIGCTDAEDCPEADACAARTCVAGSCLYSDRGTCGADRYCEPMAGCLDLPGAVDAGHDAGLDASAPFDGGRDAGDPPDTGTDGGPPPVDMGPPPVDAGPVVCPSDPRLLACYRFDGDLTDDAGSYDLTTTGATPMYRTGFHGSALVVPAGGAFTIPNSALSPPARTIEAYVNLSGSGGMVFYKPDDSLLIVQGGRPRCIMASDAGQIDAFASGMMPTGRWVHLACTLTATGTARLYVDGVMVAGQTRGNPTASSGRFGVGADPRDGSNPFEGLIDVARVWSYPRSEGEIAADAP